MAPPKVPSAVIKAVAVSAIAPAASADADLPTTAQTPAPKIEVAAKLSRPSLQPPEMPLSLPLAAIAPIAVTTLPVSPARAASVPPLPAPVSLPANTPSTAAARRGRQDLSTAPDATAAGSDYAAPGTPDAAREPPRAVPSSVQASKTGTSAADSSGSRGTSTAALQTGAESPGSYVQLKPHGDTEIMRHTAPDIGYRPSRFAKDWAPYGESSVDTALRHAVEKTTIGHTFHLPRGVRIRCTLTPLRLVSLFGCANPDPPPQPVPEKVYDRLHLPSADPLVPPAPASVAAPAPAAPIRLDNSAECATARVTGGPMPPGCAKPATYQPIDRPASASSAWVPASDQFH